MDTNTETIHHGGHMSAVQQQQPKKKKVKWWGHITQKHTHREKTNDAIIKVTLSWSFTIPIFIINFFHFLSLSLLLYIYILVNNDDHIISGRFFSFYIFPHRGQIQNLKIYLINSGCHYINTLTHIHTQ